jgi:hypothetical protein
MNSIWALRKLFHGLVPAAATQLYIPVLSQTGQAMIDSFIIANNSAAGVVLTIWAGSAMTPDHILIPGTLIGPHELWVPPIVWYIGFGESIFGQAGAANAITLGLNGGTRQ